MIKTTLILSALLTLSAAFVLHSERATTGGCLYENELWGSEDGTKFYFCLSDKVTVVEQPCPENTFFVKNATASGCLPLDKVDSKCINVDNSNPPTCTGDALKQPQPSSDPTKFYLCQSEGVAAVLLNCDNGKAFVSQDGYLGCFAWESWRTIKDCPQ